MKMLRMNRNYRSIYLILLVFAYFFGFKYNLSDAMIFFSFSFLPFFVPSMFLSSGRVISANAFELLKLRSKSERIVKLKRDQ